MSLPGKGGRSDNWLFSGTSFQDGFSGGRKFPMALRTALWAIIYEPVKHVNFAGVKLTDLSLGLVSPSGRRGLGHVLSEVLLTSEI